MDYTRLTVSELINGISETEAAIRRCRTILDDLGQPKTAGLQTAVKTTRNLMPKLEEDLEALKKAYAKRKLRSR